MTIDTHNMEKPIRKPVNRTNMVKISISGKLL
jgi:hypothetical protein